MQESLRDLIEQMKSNNKIDWIESNGFDGLAELQFNYSRRYETLYINNLQPYHFGFLTNLIGSREKLAKFLGCRISEIHETFLTLLNRPIKPTPVSSGRCQEEILIGSEANLKILPALKYNREDAGPYITAGIVIAKDFEHKFQNASIHRMQIKGSKRLGIRLEETSHLLQMQKRAEDNNKNLEVAIVIGNHPAELLASVTSLAYGVDELEIAGAIRGESLEIVKCKAVDLEVPACAEIIIEGFIPHHEKEIEGPFGDFMGYYIEPVPNHVIKVTAITFCTERPIFQSIRAGSFEDALLLGFAKEMTVYKALIQNGHQVVGVNVSPMVFSCIIAIKKRHDGEPEEIIKAAFDNYSWLKYCIIVDEDVDCYDLNDVWWAVAARSNPKYNILCQASGGFSRDPHHIHDGKMGINATVPVSLKHYFRRAMP